MGCAKTKRPSCLTEFAARGFSGECALKELQHLSPRRLEGAPGWERPRNVEKRANRYRQLVRHQGIEAGRSAGGRPYRDPPARSTAHGPCRPTSREDIER